MHTRKILASIAVGLSVFLGSFGFTVRQDAEAPLLATTPNVIGRFQLLSSSKKLNIDLSLLFIFQNVPNRWPDFDELVTVNSAGEMLVFEADGIASHLGNPWVNDGDKIRIVRYYGLETYYELVIDVQGVSLQSSEILYPWVLEEKLREIEESNSETSPDSFSASAATCNAKYKWPFMSWEPNTLTSGYGHCSCAYHAVDFNEGAGNDDCEAAVLNTSYGVVSRAEKEGNYGWAVEMDHGGSYWTRVAHGLSDPKEYIGVGNTLLQGTFLMKRGSTGRSTSCHTHLEFWKGSQSLPLAGFSCYSNISKGSTYNSYQTYVKPPRGNP